MKDKASKIQIKIYDDIGRYAQSRMADEYKQKYCPPEEEPEEAPGEEMAEQGKGEDLDEESLARLAELAGA